MAQNGSRGCTKAGRMKKKIEGRSHPISLYVRGKIDAVTYFKMTGQTVVSSKILRRSGWFGLLRKNLLNFHPKQTPESLILFLLCPISSVGSERLPYKQEAIGSNPISDTSL